jgi:hypothetical protein
MKEYIERPRRDFSDLMESTEVYQLLEELTYKVFRLEDECAIAHAKITELEEERENA